MTEEQIKELRQRAERWLHHTIRVDVYHGDSTPSRMHDYVFTEILNPIPISVITNDHTQERTIYGLLVNPNDSADSWEFRLDKIVDAMEKKYKVDSREAKQ